MREGYMQAAADKDREGKNMSDYVKALDNVGVVCHASRENFQKFAKMGFTLYPLGRQGVKLMGIFIKAGTGSIAAHFRNGGYFEMISIYNNFLPTGGYKKNLQKKGERLIKFTLELSDAKSEAARLKNIGKPAFGPMEYRRVFTSLSKGRQDARFSILAYPFPFDYPIAIAGTQHLTPNVTWQDDLIDHPNGTKMLSNALVAVDDLSKTSSSYEKIFEKVFRQEGKKRVCRFNNNSRLTLISFSDLEDEISGIKPDTSPYLVAVYFGVKNIETVRNIFEKNHIPYENKDSRVIVPSNYVFNSTYVFEQV